MINSKNAIQALSEPNQCSRRHLTSAVVLLSVCVSLAACGDSGTASTTSTSGAPPASVPSSTTTKPSITTIPGGIYDRLVTRADAERLNIDDALTDALLGSDGEMPMAFEIDGDRWTIHVTNDAGIDEVGDAGSFSYDDAGNFATINDAGALLVFVWSFEGGALTLALMDGPTYGDDARLVTEGVYHLRDGDQAADGNAADEPADTEVPTTPAVASGHNSTYATNTFTLPFEVTVPAWLPAAPSVESPNFVTWATASPADPAVRFLVPVNVYPPGGTGTIPPPEDYLAYLLSQSAHGASFVDRTETTIGGFPATLVTATVTATVVASLDGSLGCQAEALEAADCFGLQRDLTLRIAVIDAGDVTLVAWLRHASGGTGNTAEEFASFEEMLASVRFLGTSAG